MVFTWLFVGGLGWVVVALFAGDCLVFGFVVCFMVAACCLCVGAWLLLLGWLLFF